MSTANTEPPSSHSLILPPSLLHTSPLILPLYLSSSPPTPSLSHSSVVQYLHRYRHKFSQKLFKPATFLCLSQVMNLCGNKISHFWDRPVPIFSDVRFSYLALVEDKKIMCVLPANACCTVFINCPPILHAFPF
jgi:hypothetical protein